MDVSYKDSEAPTTTSEKSLRESIEAKAATITRLQTQHEGMRKRINRFIASVSSVQFSCDEADAELWTAQWGAFLLSGKEPQPPEPQPEVSTDDFDTQSE